MLYLCTSASARVRAVCHRSSRELLFDAHVPARARRWVARAHAWEVYQVCASSRKQLPIELTLGGDDCDRNERIVRARPFEQLEKPAGLIRNLKA
jgi:hypothetical protein